MPAVPERNLPGVADEGAGASPLADSLGTAPGQGIDPVSAPKAEPVPLDHIAAIKLKELELAIERQKYDTQLLRYRTVAAETANRVQTPHTAPNPVFDVSKHVSLVPPFRESEVDSNLMHRTCSSHPTLAKGHVVLAFAKQVSRKGTKGLFFFKYTTEFAL